MPIEVHPYISGSSHFYNGNFRRVKEFHVTFKIAPAILRKTTEPDCIQPAVSWDVHGPFALLRTGDWKYARCLFSARLAQASHAR